MSYNNPQKVVSPKTKLGGPVTVLFDGGDQLGDNNGFSVASFLWEGKPVIGVRWNGMEGNPGAPQSRGLPIWFVLPSKLEKAVLRALQEPPPLDITKDALKFIEQRLENSSFKDNDLFEERVVEIVRKLKAAGEI